MKIAPKQIDTSKDVIMQGGFLRVINGTEANPGLRFVTKPGTGLSLDVDSLVFSVEGIAALALESTGETLFYGNADYQNHNILQVGTVNGVTVQAHAARHLPNGADALSTAAAVALTGTSTNTVGTANSLARSDHTHDTSGLQPRADRLTQLAAATGNGVLVYTGTGYVSRTLAGTAGRIVISNGNGVSAAPTIDLASVHTPGGGGGSGSKITFDEYGRVTAAANLANTDIIAALGFTPVNAAVTSPNNTANYVVQRDANGNFTANIITANLSGNATTATRLANARTIAATGDLTWSVSFDGSANVSAAATLATVGTAGTYRSVTVNAKGLVTAGSNPTTVDSITTTATIVATPSGNTVSLAIADNVTVPGTASVRVPVGTTAQRGTAASGQVRYNTDLNAFEFYENNAWSRLNRYQREVLFAGQFESPISSGWNVVNLAPVILDPANNALPVRAFDDTQEEGVGFQTVVPVNATTLNLDIVARPQTAPTGSNTGVVWRLHYRKIAVGSATGAWTVITLNTSVFPLNANFQRFSQAISLATLGAVANDIFLFELTRQGGATADNLAGDCLVHHVGMGWT